MLDKKVELPDLVREGVLQKIEAGLQDEEKLAGGWPKRAEKLTRDIEEIMFRTPLFEMSRSEEQARSAIENINFGLARPFERLFEHVAGCRKEAMRFIMFGNKQEHFERVVQEVLRCENFMILIRSEDAPQCFNSWEEEYTDYQLLEFLAHFDAVVGEQEDRFLARVQEVPPLLEARFEISEYNTLMLLNAENASFYMLFEKKFDEFSLLLHRLITE